MPSPVAESPAREAAESMPEPTGPSKLSGPPIAAPDPTPEPTAASSSRPDQPPEDSSSAPLVQPTPEPAPAAELAPISDAVPVSTPEPSLRRSPEPVPAALYLSHSPESLSRRHSEDSGSTRSHGQVIPQTEIHAAPWDGGPLVAERSSHLEQAPLATEAPPPRVDNVSNAGIWQNNSPTFDQASAEVAGLMLKRRGSTVSSQVRPRTPSIFNGGRISRRPSVSSLASSAAALSSHPVHAAPTEPRQEGAGVVPTSNQCVRYYVRMML